MADAPALPRLAMAVPRVREVIGAGFRLHPEPELGVIKVQLYRGEGQQKLAAALGAAPPTAGTQIGLARGVDCASIAPGEWLLLGPRNALCDLAALIERDLQGALALVTDLSDGRVGFSLSGPAARDRLASVCPLDLRAKSFPPGAAARSLLGDTGLFLARLPDGDNGPVFRLVVDQTAAAYAARMIALPGAARNSEVEP